MLICPHPNAALAARVARLHVGEDLERHAPIERRIARAVHDAHPASPEHALDLIAAKRLPRSQRRGGG